MSLYYNAFLTGIGRVFSLPRLSVPLILTLGLTLGAVLSVVAISSALIFKPLQGVTNEESIQNFDFRLKISDSISASYWTMRRLADFNQAFADLGTWAGITSRNDTVNIDDRNYPITRHHASNTILDVLGTRLIKGQDVKMPSPEDYLWISESLWNQAFAGRDSAIGRQITLNETQYIIAGIIEDLMAVSGRDPVIEQQIWSISDLSTTLSQSDSGGINDELENLLLKGKNASSIPPTPAQTEQWLIKYVNDNIEEPAQYLDFINSQPKEFSTSKYRDYVLGDSSKLLLVLSAAVIGLLMMATLNLLNLFIAHYQGRGKEFSIQLSLGASLLKVRTLVLLENLPSFTLAAVCGLLAAGWVIRSLPMIAGDGLPMMEIITIDRSTVLASGIVVLLLSVLFSALSLIDIDKQSLANNLNSSGKGTRGQNNQLLSRILMIVQLSLASVLLTGSVMIAIQNYQAVHKSLGYDIGNSYSISMNFADDEWMQQLRDYETYQGSEIHQLHTSLQATIESTLPDSTFFIPSVAPLSTNIRVSAFNLDNDPQKQIIYQVNPLTPGYFETFNIPMLAGANLTQEQINNNEDLLVIDESMARKTYPDKSLQQIIGQTIIGLVEDRTFVINGIVGIAEPRSGRVESMNIPAIYNPDLGGAREVELTVVMPQGKTITKEMLADVLTREFPRLNNLNVRALNDIKLEQTLNRRVSLWLVVTMTALTLLLAAIGVGGLTQMTTHHRKYELAIRMATGAKQSNLLGFVLKDAVWMLTIGLALGFVISAIGYQQINQQLQMLPSFNWLAMSALDLGLIVVVVSSVMLPAWKVISTDPMQALRQE